MFHLKDFSWVKETMLRWPWTLARLPCHFGICSCRIRGRSARLQTTCSWHFASAESLKCISWMVPILPTGQQKRGWRTWSPNSISHQASRPVIESMRTSSGHCSISSRGLALKAVKCFRTIWTGTSGRSVPSRRTNFGPPDGFWGHHRRFLCARWRRHWLSVQNLKFYTCSWSSRAMLIPAESFDPALDPRWDCLRSNLIAFVISLAHLHCSFERGTPIVILQCRQGSWGGEELLPEETWSIVWYFSTV